MKKSRRASKIILSVFGAVLATTLITVLLVLHLLFPSKLSSEIESSATNFDVDANLVRAVIWTESKYKADVVSSKGAVGLMQLLPATAEYIAPLAGITDFSADMLYDEATNIALGTYYLRYLIDKFGTTDLAITAYNAGEGTVNSWQKEGLTEIPYKETKNYLKRVTLAKKIYDFKSK